MSIQQGIHKYIVKSIKPKNKLLIYQFTSPYMWWLQQTLHQRSMKFSVNIVKETFSETICRNIKYTVHFLQSPIGTKMRNKLNNVIQCLFCSLQHKFVPAVTVYIPTVTVFVFECSVPVTSGQHYSISPKLIITLSPM